MAYLLEVPVDGDASITIEVDAAHDQGVVRSARPGEVVKAAGESLQQMLARVRPMAVAVADLLRSVAEVDEAEAEFGLKLTATAGLVVTQAGSEAQVKIVLRWRRVPNA